MSLHLQYQRLSHNHAVDLQNSVSYSLLSGLLLILVQTAYHQCLLLLLRMRPDTLQVIWPIYYLYYYMYIKYCLCEATGLHVLNMRW
jgi:hypothetical protein